MSPGWRERDFLERNRRIFDAELDEFLPASILDFHVHLLNPGIIPWGGSFSAGGHPVPHYGVDDLWLDLAEVFPRRQTAAVCFGFPDPSYDFTANNAYVAGRADGRRCFTLRLLDPAEPDPDAVRRQIVDAGFVGLKPYPDYVRGKPLHAVEIHDMLPEWSMRIADELGLAIMLHIPRPGRLADETNQRQLVELCTRWPRARIVLAHIGRAYWLNNALGRLERLRELPNLYYDLTMVNHWEVMEHLLQRVDPSRILFGSDIPIALAPGKSVEINDQYTYVTPVPWKLSISDDHGKLAFTSFLYEEIRAFRHACRRLGVGREVVQGVFWENGMRLLDEVRGSIRAATVGR